LRGRRLFDFKVIVRTRGQQLVVNREGLRDLLDGGGLFILLSRLAVVVTVGFRGARFVMFFGRSVLFALRLHALSNEQELSDHI
jgi:hypothetical protein